MAYIHQRELAPLDPSHNARYTVPNDAEIESTVMNALHHQSGVPSDHICAVVKNGEVTLTGVIHRTYEGELAVQQASATSGVLSVINNLTLTS